MAIAIRTNVKSMQEVRQALQSVVKYLLLFVQAPPGNWWPRPPSGGWTTGLTGWATSGNEAITIGQFRLVAVPLLLPKSLTITSVGVHNHELNAEKCYMGVYDNTGASGNYPGTLLYGSPETTCSDAFVTDALGTAITLPKGVSWLVIHPDNAHNFGGCAGCGAAGNIPFPWRATTAPASFRGYSPIPHVDYYRGSFSALPDPFPAGAAETQWFSGNPLQMMVQR